MCRHVPPCRDVYTRKIRLLRAVGLHSTAHEPVYVPTPPPEDADTALRLRMRELAEIRPRFGVARLHVLLRRELVVKHKRTERVYQEEKLSLRLKKRTKRPSHLRMVQPAPTRHDEQWAMDFMSDTPTDNGHIESFNGKVRDECLNQNAFLSLTDARNSLESGYMILSLGHVPSPRLVE